MRDAEVEPAEPTRAVEPGRERHVLGAELEPRDPQDHVADALTDLDGCTVHLRGAVLGEYDPRGAVVVESLGVADVLEADGEPDSAPNAFSPRRVAGSSGQADCLTRKLLGLGKRERRGSPDDLARGKRAGHDLAGRERAARLERVEQPELDGIDVERSCELVHLRLGGEARLDCAEPAHRTAGRVVRVDDEAVDVDVVDGIRSDGERARVGQHCGRARRISAAVEEDPHADGYETPVARRAVLGPDPRRVTVDVPDERLLAVVDDLHRAARVERQHGGVDLHGQVLASTECSSHAGEVDPHLLRFEAEARRDLIAVDVEPLGRDVDVDAALPVRDRDAGLGAEERLILLAGLVDAFHHDVAGHVGIAAPDHHGADDVGTRVVPVAVTHRGPVGMERIHLGRALGVRDRIERLVLDADRGSRAPCLLGLVRGDDRDGLAEVADAVDRQHGLVRELEAVGLRAGHVLVREHRMNAGQRQRLREIDRDDPCVNVRAPDRPTPEHPGRAEIARERELAGDFRHGVGAPRGRNGGAASQRPRRAAHRLAATRTASRIFWYPVQRHRLPESASRISSSVGSDVRRRRSAAATTNPGVQKPHCTAPASANASWTGWRAPSAASPSTVTTSCPSACAASTRHEQTSSPSRRTEHEPHSPCSQAFFDPGSASRSRSVVRRLSPAQTSVSWRSPFTVISTLMRDTCRARVA